MNPTVFAFYGEHSDHQIANLIARAGSLSDEQIARARKEFETLDENGDGVIDASKVKAGAPPWHTIRARATPCA